MSLHIAKFVDKVRTAELKKQRDIIMSVRDAQDLHADITKLLNALTAAHEELGKRTQDPVTAIQIEGGSF
jgi:hypothetical protein